MPASIPRRRGSWETWTSRLVSSWSVPSPPCRAAWGRSRMPSCCGTWSTVRGSGVASRWAPAWGSRTYVMGVVNVTPDSFSGDGVGRDPGAALRKAEELAADGADVIDIGGESTRPGYVSVELGEELERVIPAVELIAGQIAVPLSVDTSKAEVARPALAA